MSRPGAPQLGVTLYSFTPDFHRGRYTTEELILRCGELGLGPGLELVGFQSLRGFPRPEAAVLDGLRSAIEASGLTPACLAINADAGIHPDRLMDDDEMTAYMEPQLRLAGELGFPTVRVQYNAGPAVLERLLPTAERLNVKMGMELHSPSTVESPWVVALLELIDRAQSPCLGFIPDFGATTRRLSPSLLEEFRRRGASEALLNAAASRWEEQRERPGSPATLIPELMQTATSDEERALVQAMGPPVFGIHGQAAVDSWREILPYVVHVHAKFFGFDEAGREPAVPYEELLPIFADGGYAGFLSSEWEGWHWDWTPDAFAMVAAHHRLCRSILEAA